MVAYSQNLPIGWEPPDFNLKDTQGHSVGLSDFESFPALLVVFTCNYCKYAQASWAQLIELYEQFGRQIPFVAINPYDGRVTPTETQTKMLGIVTQFHVPFPYLHDSSQEVAKSFNVSCTPEPFLFKNDGSSWQLFYHGRINDNWQHPKDAQQHDLQRAMQKVMTKQNPPIPQHTALGCAIEWQSQK